MNSARKLLDLAELGHAAYGQFISPIGRIQSNETLTNPNGRGMGLAAEQAERFRNRFHVAIPTYNDETALDGGGTGFDVTVFKGVQSDNSNQISVAIRGTQQGLEDGTLADILLHGAAIDQIVAMHNWWKRVSTAVGTTVSQFSLAGYPNQNSIQPPVGSTKLYELVGGTAFYLVPGPSVLATGEIHELLAADPDAKVDVIGTSLGGHLAMAFNSLFGSQVGQAAAFNSPGFASNAGVLNLFAALGGTVPAVGTPRLLNFISDEANKPGNSVDIISDHNSIPGQRINVPIENQFFTDVPDPKFPSWNHDQRQVDDALTLYVIFSRMQADFSLDSLRTLMRNAATGPTASLENLVNATESFLGLSKSVLPASNAGRDALHSAVGRLGTALDGPLSASLGSLLLRASSADLRAAARNDFSALIALQELSPIWISGNTAAADDTVWQSTRAADYAAWPDRAEGGRELTTSIATWPAAYPACAKAHRQAVVTCKAKSQ